MTPRILVTGSRAWTDRQVMYLALLQHAVRLRRETGEIPTLVHGDCEGADRMAAELYRPLKKPEPHPANWKDLGRAAGPIRNQLMVDLGADVCLAFPMRGSRGTWDCVRRAREAGIPVEVFEEVKHG